MLIAPEISTSQGIAKALKGPGLTCEEKIQTAVAAWETSSIYFPHKDEFLLDWLSSMLVKPPTKKKEENPQLDGRYWELLRDILSHFVVARASDRIPAIRVPLILAFAAVFNNYSELRSLHHEKVLSLYRAVHDCLGLLSQPTFTFAYRPPIDQLFATFEYLISVIDEELNKEGTGNEILLAEFVKMANLIMPQLEAHMLTSANQRKTFSTILGKPFGSVIRVYFGVSKKEDTVFIDMKQCLDQLLQNALFHSDTILEYPTVLQTTLNNDTNSSKNQSYVKKLFDELGELIRCPKADQDMEATLYILSPLFAMFVQGFRKKRNALTMSNVLKNMSSMDVNRTVEFGFFQAMYSILIDARSQLNASLEALNSLLQNILQMNVYHATNDTLAKEQHSFLANVTTILFSHLADKRLQGLALRGFWLLLEIDDSLIEPYMADLWPYILDPVEDAEKEALDLAKAILNTFAKSRQVGEYIQSFIQALKSYGEDKTEYFLRKPIFSPEFLNEFSSCIFNNVPPPQALSIFQIFVDHISSPNVAEQPAKKRKTSTSPVKDSPLSHRLVVELLCQFLQSIRLTQQQKMAFSDSLVDVSNNIVMKRLLIADNIDDLRTALPALNFHQALLNTFSDIYFNILSTTTKDDMSSHLQRITALSFKHSSNLSLTTMLSSINATLQYSYYCLLSNYKPSTVSLEDLVNFTLTTILPKIPESDNWNGRLIDLNAKNIGTACWKILSEDWLPTASSLASAEHLSDINGVLLSNARSDIQEPSQFSVHGINLILLRSAEFYELVNLREYAFKTLYSGFTTNISLLAEGSQHSDLLLSLSTALQDDSPRIQPLVQKALPLFQQMTSDQNSAKLDNDVLINFFIQLEKIHLFPMEYFNKYQRQHLLLAMVLIERLFCLDSFDLYERNRLALLCRSFAYKLVRFRGEVSFLAGDSIFLRWWIRSTEALYVDDEANTKGNQMYQNVVKITISLETLLLSKMMDDVNAGNQNATSVIAACEAELRSMFLKEKSDSRYDGRIHLEFIIAFVAAFNHQIAASAKRREQSQSSWKLGKLQIELEDYVVSSCLELKKKMNTFLQTHSGSTVSSGRDELINNSKLMISFSSTLALSHQLLTQHYMIVDAQDRQHSNLLAPILSVISPCLKFLQLYISSQELTKGKVLSKLLGVCGEMAVTLCSATPEIHNNDVTQRTIAFVWFAYELAHSHDEVECKKLVDTAFTSLVQTLPNDQFKDVLDCILQKANLDGQSEERSLKLTAKTETLLHFMWLLLDNCSADQRKLLREDISAVIMMISNIMDRAVSHGVLKQSLVLLADIVNDQNMGLRSYDISLVLTGITQLRSPSLPSRITTSMSKQDANQVFESIYKVLSGILKNRRQQLVQVITPFTATLEDLLHCFRSLHPSVAVSTRKRKQDSKKRQLQDQPFSLLTDHAPLSEMCAHNYARLLEGLGDQSASNTANTTTGKSHNLAKAFSKHSPYILAEYLSIQSNPISTISQPTLKSALRPGLFALLDICGEHERDMLMASIDTSQKMLLKTLHTEWSKTHRYTGR